MSRCVSWKAGAYKPPKAGCGRECGRPRAERERNLRELVCLPGRGHFATTSRNPFPRPASSFLDRRRNDACPRFLGSLGIPFVGHPIPWRNRPSWCSAVLPKFAEGCGHCRRLWRPATSLKVVSAGDPPVGRPFPSRLWPVLRVYVSSPRLVQLRFS